jgi:hypothetical protein
MSKSIYEKTYRDYLVQIEGLDWTSLGEKLGCDVEGNEAFIPVFGRVHRVSGKGVFDPWEKQPALDLSVILFKYLLLCPDIPPKDSEWVSYRGLKNSGPLTKYFSNDVEQAIAEGFKGRVDALAQAGEVLGGYPPAIQASYDLTMQLDALPHIPLVILYNDADDEFPATCSVLFERRAERYLDAECLAMLGRLLFIRLKEAADPGTDFPQASSGGDLKPKTETPPGA